MKNVSLIRYKDFVPIYLYLISEGNKIVRPCDRHRNETVTLRKHVTKHKYMRNWIVDYLSKSQSLVIKIARINSQKQLYQFILISHVRSSRWRHREYSFSDEATCYQSTMGPRKNSQVKLIQFHMHEGSQHSPIFRALPLRVHSHSYVAEGHLHTIHLAQPRSPSSQTSTNFCHQHHSVPTILIHSFHMPKPSQYSLIRSTRQNPSGHIYGIYPFFQHAQTISILSNPTLIRATSFKILSFHDTATKLFKHFISRTFTFLLSELLITRASAPNRSMIILCLLLCHDR